MVSEVHRINMMPAYITAATKAGIPAPTICVHAETCVHLHKTLAEIRDSECLAGVALDISTSASVIEHVLDLVDVVLVMTVDPGGGGRPFLPTMLTKISQLRALFIERGCADRIEIHADGGIKPDGKNARACVSAGAKGFVVGSALFSHAKGPAVPIAMLRAATKTL